jgi:deazaflavin-dependent oxidoreductase (nitroreductase family)
VAQVGLAARRERFYRAFGKLHTRLLVRTNGRPEHLTVRLRCLVLQTIGRNSGRVHCVALAYLPDGDAFIVLASNFGQDREPAWWRNLQARPDAIVHVGGRLVSVRAREITGPERDAMLSRAMTHNKQWRVYAATMRRTLPVIRLERESHA